MHVCHHIRCASFYHCMVIEEAEQCVQQNLWPSPQATVRGDTKIDGDCRGPSARSLGPK